MSRWIRRMVMTTVIGMFAVTAASAQPPQPMAPGAPVPGAAPVVVGPAPTFVQAPGAPAFVQGGCCTAATTSDCGCNDRKHGKGRLHNRHCYGNGKCAGLTIGSGCANSVNCSSCATHRTFVFGSCNQFFNPGNKCGGCGLFGRAHCATEPLGTGIVPGHPCVYGSYLNR